MKKIIIIGITILSVILIGWWWWSDDTKRTPDYVLRVAVENDFEINMNEINPSVTYFDEQWCPNGDGYCYIEFKYEGDPPDFFKQFKQLSANNTMSFGQINSHFRNLKQGYYMFTRDVIDPRNFKVLVIDPKERIGVLYYEYL